jgi:hypothetical protein
VEWGIVIQKEIPPPWVPDVMGEEDSQYFDDYSQEESGGPQEYGVTMPALEISEDTQRVFEGF